MKRKFFTIAFLASLSASAQQVGSKVFFRADANQTYIGTVAEIKGGKYRVVYDNTDFDAWLTPEQFSVAANPSQFTRYKTEQQQQTQTAPAARPTQTAAAKPKPSNNAVATKADIEAYIKSSWDKPNGSPKKMMTVNNIVIGNSEPSNYAQQLEGVPKGSTVTHAKIDFTQFTYYSNETQQTRQIMTAWVFRDQFGEWRILNVHTDYPQ